MSLELELAQFTGTESWYKTLDAKTTYTDGVKYLADSRECYWFIDIIVSYQHLLRKKDFQVWTLTVHDNRTATVTCKEDSDQEPIVTQEIPYTDFSEYSVEVWLSGGVILLPSEY